MKKHRLIRTKSTTLPIRNQSTVGFTIVELMIVIIVIAILSTIAVLSLAQIQKMNRDSERQADVSIIMDVLEKYYATHGEYPSNDSLNPSGSMTALSNYNAIETILPGLTNDILTGPTGATFFTYNCATSCTDSASNLLTYRSKQYIYTSWNSISGSNWYLRFDNNNGMASCEINTTFSKPGYVIAYKEEASGLWIFKKSKHGDATVSNWSTGPIAPQTCAFS